MTHPKRLLLLLPLSLLRQLRLLPNRPLRLPQRQRRRLTRASRCCRCLPCWLRCWRWAAAAWSWSDSRERIRDLKTELGRRLAESGKDVSETRLLARNADDAMRQVSEKVARIETQMVTSQQQQQALETLYKDLAQGRDQWTLAEIEQVLLTAAQQLQLAGNVKAAIIALEGADTRLQRLNKPQFTALRRAIATDLASLRAVPSIDEVGTSARIEALVARSVSWPLASAQGIRSGARAATCGRRQPRARNCGRS